MGWRFRKQSLSGLSAEKEPGAGGGGQYRQQGAAAQHSGHPPALFEGRLCRCQGPLAGNGRIAGKAADPGRRDIIVKIQEGGRHIVKAVRIQGNKALDTAPDSRIRSSPVPPAGFIAALFRNPFWRRISPRCGPSIFSTDFYPQRLNATFTPIRNPNG